MKQVFLALTVIMVVASLAMVGTYASFSDIETSQDNYLETGSLDLQLGDDAPVVMRSGSTTPEYPGGTAEGYGEDPLGDSVEETWLLPQADVGDTVNSLVWVRNVGSLPGDHLDVYCTINNIDFYGGTSNKDEMLVINYLTYYDTFNSFNIPIVYTINNVQYCTAPYMANMDSDSRITLNDLELHGIPGLPVPIGDFIQLEMSVTFDPTSNPNQYQGDETQMTLMFALMQ